MFIRYCFLFFTFFAIQTSNAQELAPVRGFARSFPISAAISHAKITVLETGKVYKTDVNGNFGPIFHPVGKPITLMFKKRGYKTTQSATIIVPKEGLVTRDKEISFQIPSSFVYKLYSHLIGAKIDKNSCHVAATIAALGKNLNNNRQGEVGATVSIEPVVAEKPFYFDIFESGPFKNKTNPFTRSLTKVSADGGVAYINLPARDKPYTLRAQKEGKVFSEAKFICRKNVFINISPPHGPSVIG